MEIKKIFVILSLILGSLEVSAQILVDDPPQESQPPASSPAVGKKAASEYFKKRSNAESESKSDRRSEDEHGSRNTFVAIHIGTFVNDKAYRWGASSHATDVGQGMFGVTFRAGDWWGSSDLLFRAEMMAYDVDGKHPTKLSLMPIVAFPDAGSDFPLYFGAGAGAGIFFKQVGNDSDLSLDYALLIGARFAHLFEAGGLFVETGLKGQVFLLSSGQQSGVFLSAGGIFFF